MSVAQQAKGSGKDVEPRQDCPQRHPRSQHSRTRNGCERCRAQRRKCDEQKPGCKRCINAGVECNYIKQISFLQHKSKPLPIKSVSDGALAPARATYPSLQVSLLLDQYAEALTVYIFSL